jgi:hypothetical protein
MTDNDNALQKAGGSWLASGGDESAAAHALATEKLRGGELSEALELYSQAAARAQSVSQFSSAISGVVLSNTMRDNFADAEKAAEMLPRKGETYEYMVPMFLRGWDLHTFMINELVETVDRLEQIVGVLTDKIHTDFKSAKVADDASHIGSQQERKSLTRFVKKVRELHGEIKWDKDEW